MQVPRADVNYAAPAREDLIVQAQQLRAPPVCPLKLELGDYAVSGSIRGRPSAALRRASSENTVFAACLFAFWRPDWPSTIRSKAISLPQLNNRAGFDGILFQSEAAIGSILCSFLTKDLPRKWPTFSEKNRFVARFCYVCSECNKLGVFAREELERFSVSIRYCDAVAGVIGKIFGRSHEGRIKGKQCKSTPQSVYVVTRTRAVTKKVFKAALSKEGSFVGA